MAVRFWVCRDVTQGAGFRQRRASGGFLTLLPFGEGLSGRSYLAVSAMVWASSAVPAHRVLVAGS
jgi:hypothetical protein